MALEETLGAERFEEEGVKRQKCDLLLHERGSVHLGAAWEHEEKRACNSVFK